MSQAERRRTRQFRAEPDERRKARDPVRIFVLLRALRNGPPGGTTGPASLRTVKARTQEAARLLEDYVLGPCDEAALQAALALKASVAGNASVTTLSASGSRDDEAVTHALERGADRAVTVVDPALALVDYFGVARALAAALDHLGHDLVLAGESSLDEAQGVVGPAVAEMLGIRHVTAARRLAVDGSGLSFERREAGLIRKLKLPLPALLTVGVSASSQPPEPLPARPEASAIERLDLAAIGLSAPELHHRERTLGTSTPMRATRNVLLVKSAGELIERLREDRLLE